MTCYLLHREEIAAAADDTSQLGLLKSLKEQSHFALLMRNDTEDF